MSTANRQQFPSRNRRRLVRAMVLVVPLVVTVALAAPKMWQGDFNVDTGWYSAIALQAFRAAGAGDWSALWALRGVGGEGGAPYFNKPPVGFWLGGWPLWVFGPSIWAARLGSVAAAALCVLATVFMVRRASGPRAAAAAGLVLATSIPFITLARSFSLDLWTTVFLVVAVAATVEHARREGEREGRGGRAWCVVVGAVGIGLALLTKPVAPLLAVVPLAAWAMAGRRWRTAGAAGGMAVGGVLVALPWHLAMAARFGRAFMDQYFGAEMLDRAAAKPTANFNRGAEGWWYYAQVLVETWWPWLAVFGLVLAAMALRRVPRGQTRRGRLTDREALLLGVVWTVVWLVALSMFADKRPRYLSPLFPVWAWMCGLWLTRAGWGAPAVVRGAWRGIVRWAAPAAVVGAMVISIAPVRVHRGRDEEWDRLLGWIDEHPDVELHQGGFVGQRAARIYLHAGRWPSPSPPREGAHIVYHARDGLMPGPNERVVLQAGKLTITRLEEGAWMPVRIDDPGE